MKDNQTLNQIKAKVDELKGKNIKMLVNRGRKKTEELEGVIQSLYPSVFTVMLLENWGSSIVTYSYTEVLCGHVKFVKNHKNSSK